jgi:hypothetical protein
MVVALIAWWTIHAERRVFERTVGKRETVDLATVITQIRSLNRLETASMHMVHVANVEQSYGIVPDVLAGDELTFYAEGDVIAGVDLSRLQPGDVRVENGTAIVRLPSPEILVSRIDNNKSKIISRKTGLFRKHDPTMESRIRGRAESSMRNEAVQKGILPLAQRNAEERLASLIRQFGFNAVRFEQGSRPAEPQR